MQKTVTFRLSWFLVITVFFVAALAGCSKKEEAKAPSSASENTNINNQANPPSENSAVNNQAQPTSPGNEGTVPPPGNSEVNDYSASPPPLDFSGPPDVVVVPSGDASIYMVPNMTGVYFYNDNWYRYYGKRWYRSNMYNGTWTYLESSIVPMVILNVSPEYPRYLPHNYHRIHYNEFHDNWRTWDHDRHWQRQSWYQNESKKEVQNERHSQLERERMRSEGDHGNGSAQTGPNGVSRTLPATPNHNNPVVKPVQGNLQGKVTKQGQEKLPESQARVKQPGSKTQAKESKPPQQAKQPNLQPQAKKPGLKPQAKESKPHMQAQQPNLQPQAKKHGLKPQAKESKPHLQAQQPNLQPQAKEPGPKPQAKESKPQSPAKQPKPHMQAQQPNLKPQAKKPGPKPQAKESKPQSPAKQP
jgi:hypothetical protein